jgi:protein-tyrosine phosphatase
VNPRRLALEGASNFRDFGDYATPDGRVRPGMLYRSDRLSRLTGADYDVLNARGIRLVVDLRRESERQAEPTRWLGASQPEHLHTPLFVDEDGPNTLQRVVANPAARTDPAHAVAVMVELYRRLIREPTARQRYSILFERIAASESLPVVIHCSGGKDRTGVLAALILGALGVSRCDIVEDFMLTAQFYDGLANLQERAAQVFQYQSGDWAAEALVPVFTVQHTYIEAALDAAEADYRSVSEFLVAGVGIDQSVIDRLKFNLIE